jgi:hypothetical protein
MFYKRKKVVHFTLNLKDVKGTPCSVGTVGTVGHHEARESNEELLLRLKFEKNMRKLFGISKKI